MQLEITMLVLPVQVEQTVHGDTPDDDHVEPAVQLEDDSDTHDVFVMLPGGDIRPTGHAEHTDGSVTVSDTAPESENVFAGQVTFPVHVDTFSPAEEPKNPAVQLEQDVRMCAEIFWNVPARHSTQAEPDHRFPELQVMHALADVLPAGDIVPAVHWVHDVAPIDEYEPAEHGEQDVAPINEYEPAEHGEQTVPFKYLPASQISGNESVTKG